jgi:GTP-binding protein
MKIVSAEFVKSAFEKGHWTTDWRPEIAFLGRSNVGKSSLLNSLLLRKGLARTSNTPGRTQSINFFIINAGNPVAAARDSDKKGFCFFDLPGYGYARVSKTMRADWGKMAEEYLRDREQLALCVQLIDSRHMPSSLDIQLNEWLEFNQKPHLIVATKSDKISRNELRKSLAEAQTLLPGAKILSFSARTGDGRDRVWAEINAAMNI